MFSLHISAFLSQRIQETPKFSSERKNLRREQKRKSKWKSMKIYHNI